MKPLKGVRIAVTRPASQAAELGDPLRAAGAHVITTPLIRVAPALVEGGLREAANTVTSYDWLIFSSVNGVELFLAAVRAVGSDPVALRKIHVACVGPATATAAQHAGLTVEVMPERFVGDAIVDALATRTELAGKRILLARAGGARLELADGLRARGAQVDDVEVYRSVPDEPGAYQLQKHVQAGAVDVVTFTAPSAVRVFKDTVGVCGDVKIAVIGPVTGQAVAECGYRVNIQADPHTIDGLVGALQAHYAGGNELEER